MANRARADREQNARQNLLDAATKLFAERGYSGTSVREIVQASGVTKPALYYWFGSKEALCLAIVRNAFAELDSRLDSKGPSRSGAEELVKFISAHFEYAAARPDLARFMYYLNFAPAGEASFLSIEEFNSGWLRRVAEIVRHLAREGLVQRKDRETAAKAIAGMINICLMQHIKQGLPLNGSLLNKVARFILRR